MSKDIDPIMLTVGAIAIVVPVVFLTGFTYQLMWNWFIVPFGAANLSLPHAIGIACIVGMLKPTPPTDKDDPSRPLKIAIVHCLLVLSIGYIAKQWM